MQRLLDELDPGDSRGDAAPDIIAHLCRSIHTVGAVKHAVLRGGVPLQPPLARDDRLHRFDRGTPARRPSSRPHRPPPRQRLRRLLNRSHTDRASPRWRRPAASATTLVADRRAVHNRRHPRPNWRRPHTPTGGLPCHRQQSRVGRDRASTDTTGSARRLHDRNVRPAAISIRWLGPGHIARMANSTARTGLLGYHDAEAATGVGWNAQPRSTWSRDRLGSISGTAPPGCAGPDGFLPEPSPGGYGGAAISIRPRRDRGRPDVGGQRLCQRSLTGSSNHLRRVCAGGRPVRSRPSPPTQPRSRATTTGTSARPAGDVVLPIRI